MTDNIKITVTRLPHSSEGFYQGYELHCRECDFTFSTTDLIHARQSADSHKRWHGETPR